MFYGNDMYTYISENIDNKFEDAFSNEDQSLNEAVFFISKEAKDLKRKIKAIIKEEFKDNRSLGSKIKGAFSGKNKTVFRASYTRALKRIVTLVNGRLFGPCSRSRAYSTGFYTVYETYYVSSIYSILKSNNKMIHIEYEYDSTLFSFSEFECRIPLDFVEEVLKITNPSYDIKINKKSICAYAKNSVVKDKQFADKILNLALQRGIEAKLDMFKSTVVFKV